MLRNLQSRKQQSDNSYANGKNNGKNLKGKFVNIKINDAKTWTLYGELVEE